MAKYKDPNTGEVIEVGDASLNPGLVSGKTLVSDSTPLGRPSINTSAPTSEMGMGSTEQAVNILNQKKSIIDKLSPAPISAPQEQKSTVSKDQTAPKVTGGLTFAEAAELFGDNFTGVKQNEDGTYTPDSVALGRLGVKTSSPATASSDSQLAQAKTDLTSATSSLKNLDVSNDPALQSQILGITNIFDERIRQMERANASRVAAINTLGIRGGSRYAGGAGGVMGGIVSAEEKDGIERIASLQAEKQAAIAEAKVAYENKEWNKYAKLVDLAQKNYENIVKEVGELNKLSIEENKKARERVVQASRDSSIADLFSKGITDPAKILDYLNFDGSGKQVGNITLKEIGESITTLTGAKEGELPTIGKEFEYMKAYLPAGATPLDYIRLKANAERKATEAGAGQNVTFDQFSNESIALSAIPTTLRNSEVELKRYLEGIRLGLKSGKTPYDIADTLMGYKIAAPDNFSNGLRKYISLADLNGAEIGETARLVNAKEYSKAISKIEDKIYQQAKKSSSDNFIDESNVRFATTKSNEIFGKISSLGTNAPVGIVSGTMEKWLSRLKGKDAQKIQQSVVTLVADMRNRLSGTAVTEGEKKFLDPLIPDLSDTPANFMLKLEELKNAPLQRLNSVRSTYELPTLDEVALMNRNKRVPLYSASNTFMETATPSTISSNGQEYDVGRTYEDASGSKWQIDSAGKWVKVQ